MSPGSIIGRYIFREMIPPFLLSLALFTFVFLMAKILDMTDLIINYGVKASSVLVMLACFIPSFMVFVIPMSTMMAVLLAFLRLSHDQELVALKAGGVSVYGLLPPALAFCLAGCLVTGFMTIYGSPWGRSVFKILVFEAAASNIEMGLKERVFNDTFKGLMLYVNQIDPRNRILKDVFIEDRQTPAVVSTVIAPKGKFFSDPERLNFRLTLFNGTANRVDLKSKAVDTLRFDSYDLSLELGQVLQTPGRKGRKEMTLGELRENLREPTKSSRYNSMLMEYHKRFAMPIGCFVLGLVAVSLGIQSKFSGRSFGMVLGLVFFLIYYILISAGWICGESGMCPPVIGTWGPDLLVGAMGVYLLKRTAGERPLAPIFLILNKKARGSKASRR